MSDHVLDVRGMNYSQHFVQSAPLNGAEEPNWSTGFSLIMPQMRFESFEPLGGKLWQLGEGQSLDWASDKRSVLSFSWNKIIACSFLHFWNWIRWITFMYLVIWEKLTDQNVPKWKAESIWSDEYIMLKFLFSLQLQLLGEKIAPFFKLLCLWFLFCGLTL